MSLEGLFRYEDSDIYLPFEKQFAVEEVKQMLNRKRFERGKAHRMALDEVTDLWGPLLTGKRDEYKIFERLRTFLSQSHNVMSTPLIEYPGNTFTNMPQILDLASNIDGSSKLHESLGLFTIWSKRDYDSLHRMGAIATDGEKGYSTLCGLRRMGVERHWLPTTYIAQVPETEGTIRKFEKAGFGSNIIPIDCRGHGDPDGVAKSWRDKYLDGMADRGEKARDLDEMYQAGSIAGMVGLALKTFIENGGRPDYYIQGTRTGVGPAAFAIAGDIFDEATGNTGKKMKIIPAYDEGRIPAKSFQNYFSRLETDGRMNPVPVKKVEAGYLSHLEGYDQASLSAVAAFPKAMASNYIGEGKVWVAKTGRIS